MCDEGQRLAPQNPGPSCLRAEGTQGSAGFSEQKWKDEIVISEWSPSSSRRCARSSTAFARLRLRPEASMPRSLTADAPFLSGRARAATFVGPAPITTMGPCTRLRRLAWTARTRRARRTRRTGTTPLRALWQYAPYFHDGSAATLADVVAHYNRVRSLGLRYGAAARPGGVSEVAVIRAPAAVRPGHLISPRVSRATPRSEESC